MIRRAVVRRFPSPAPQRPRQPQPTPVTEPQPWPALATERQPWQTLATGRQPRPALATVPQRQPPPAAPALSCRHRSPGPAPAGPGHRALARPALVTLALGHRSRASRRQAGQRVTLLPGDRRHRRHRGHRGHGRHQRHRGHQRPVCRDWLATAARDRLEQTVPRLSNAGSSAASRSVGQPLAGQPLSRSARGQPLAASRSAVQPRCQPFSRLPLRAWVGDDVPEVLVGR